MQSAPQVTTMSSINTNVFKHREYDVTNYCGAALFFLGVPYSTKLFLEPEFVVREDTALCGSNRSRKPYGEVNVDRTTLCCCFVSVNGVSPGCGCRKELVDEISTELQLRVGNRGITGQVQKAEQTMQLLIALDAKVDALDRKVQLIVEKMNR